ncbi:hypothetical protein RchiOBHm_Chr5g0056291 [Rosa chinensis]|uniref:Uncharacterized protein n=1 Tax=Rosa chinensis TaxID=74649 RepID=A0A2P6QGL8_ROSCH|nr:hypothetical protein RchiOBHm_Chr5g0056291 [Rosa chinensis]
MQTMIQRCCFLFFVVVNIIHSRNEICIRNDLVKEQVFILGRMENAKQTLAIIINKLGDIEGVSLVYRISALNLNRFFSYFLPVVEFVSMQHDDELWEELIQQCLHNLRWYLY